MRDSSEGFLDLDLGRQAKLPKELQPGANANVPPPSPRAWGAQRKFDLLCIKKAGPDGKLNYVLSGIDLQLWEIDRYDAKKISEFIKRGELPKGRRLDGELLLHRDAKVGDVPAKKSSFLYVTREQGMGLITITDFVTQAKDITGMFGAPAGVGFYRGVRFDYLPIAR